VQNLVSWEALMFMNAKQIWQTVLERIKPKISAGAYQNVFIGTSGISVEGRMLRVRVGSTYAAEALETRFKPQVCRILFDLLGLDVQVQFEMGRAEDPPEHLVPGVIVSEIQEKPPAQHLSTAVPRVSPPRAWQQPLLPGPAAPQEVEGLESNRRVTRPLVARPQLLSDEEGSEAQVVPAALGFVPLDESRVVEARPSNSAPISRFDSSQRQPSQPSLPHDEEHGVSGTLFDEEELSQQPASLPAAQQWRPWLQAASTPQVSSAEPEDESPRSLSSAPVERTSASLPPGANGALRALSAPLEEVPEPDSPAHEPAPGVNEHPVLAPRPAPRVEMLGPRNQASMPFPDDEGMLNTRYTFETFMVGQSNGFAYNAAKAVSQGMIQGMNPLFLYGGVGLGKTHLLHAIGHVVRARGLKVLYTTSENFTNEIINAIRFHSTDQFREKYRQLDMLMVDDIQLIAGKEATEEEFFNTFNVLHLANKHIVLSSDRSPNQIGKLHERLRSRLAWGIQPEIVKPEYELRVAILRFKAQQSDLKLTDAVIELFAKPECDSVRELESLVSRLLLYTQSEKRNITMAIALELYESWQQSKKKGIFDLGVVLRGVAQKYEIKVEDLLSPRRDRRFAWPRQILMYLLREKAKMRFEQVGAAVGGRDHSTVMHAVDQVNSRMKKDAEFGPQLTALWLEIEENFPRRGER
jgi:chromosomal replication initiator protein DnaA